MAKGHSTLVQTAAELRKRGIESAVALGWSVFHL